MKKKINILLIAIVVTIWVFVFYKSISAFYIINSNTDYEKKYEVIKLSQIRKDNFTFSSLIYDPFLNKVTNKKSQKTRVYKSNKNKKNELKQIKHSLINVKNVKNNMSIKYYGYIKSSSNSDVIILLKINDSIKRISLRKKDKKYSIINYYKDSIILTINKEKITVKKNKN